MTSNRARPPLERPPLDIYKDKFFALSERNVTGAYDDQLPKTKRCKTDNGRKNYVERPASLGRYDVVSSVPRALRGTHGNDPIASMGVLGRVPAEVRDNIFRYILLSPKEIRVLRVWSLVFPRDCPQLELALIRTCEVFRRQGLRILYGENRFVYRNRDPSEGDKVTPWVLRKIFNHSHFPIDRHGHLIRYIRIDVEDNRMDRKYRENFVRSLTKFGPNSSLSCPANLHTVTIEVPALTLQDMINDKDAIGSVPNPSHVPICRFFGKSAIEALEKLDTKFIRILAVDKHNNVLETVIDMRYHVSDQRQQRRNRMAYKYPEANYDEDDDAVASDEVMKRTRERLARASLTHLRNLPLSLQLLALYPQRSIYKWNLWDVAAPVARPPTLDISLPDDFGDLSERGLTPRGEDYGGSLRLDKLEKIYSESEESAGGDHARRPILGATSSPPTSSLDFLHNVSLAKRAAKTHQPVQNASFTTTKDIDFVNTNPHLESPVIKSLANPVKRASDTNVFSNQTQNFTDAKYVTASLASGLSRNHGPLAPTQESPYGQNRQSGPDKKYPKDKDMKDPTPSPVTTEQQRQMKERMDELEARAAPGVAEARAMDVAKKKKEEMHAAREAARVAAAALARHSQDLNAEAKEAAEQEAATKESAMNEAIAAYKEAKAALGKAREYTETFTRQLREADKRERKERYMRQLRARRKMDAARSQENEKQDHKHLGTHKNA